MPLAKRVAAGVETLCDGTLQLVLDFVGPGYCLHAGTVCRAWRESYHRVAAITLAVTTWDGRSISFICGPSHTLRSAAFSSRATLRWAYNWGLDLEVKEYIAAKTADLATLAIAIMLGMPLTAELMHSAARFQKFNVLEWLHIDARCSLPQDITHSAAKGGSIVLLQWLAAAGCVFDRRTSYHAALAGHMHVLQFLLKKGCRFDKDCIDAAAERGDLLMVQWLRQQGCPWRKSEVVHLAAESGCVALMDWLLHEPEVVVMTHDLMASAAEAGQLAMCQYLREQGCPWSPRACLDAARAGHCDVVKWLHGAGCPWQPASIGGSMVVRAAMCSSVEILDYLLQQDMLTEGGALAEALTEALAAAGVHDSLAAAVWLRQHGAEWPADLRYNTVPWSRAMVAWARAEGCTAPVSASYTDPYSEPADVYSSGGEWSIGSDTDESSNSDHNFNSDASSTLHTDDSDDDDGGENLFAVELFL
jgi:hypothetical protein